MDSLVELLKSKPNILPQLTKPILFPEQPQSLTNHLTGGSIASRTDAVGDHFFQFGG